MSSRDFGFLTLRNTMAYQPNGFRVPPNNIFVTGVNGGAFFSNDVSVSSLSVSTLNTGTINISTLNTSTITANTISTNILAANYISTYQQLVFFDNNFSTCVLDNIGSTLYIDGHPVVTDAIVSTVSSVYWNGGPNGTIYNKNIGLAPNYYQAGVGTAGAALNGTLSVQYQGGDTYGNAFHISTNNNTVIVQNDNLGTGDNLISLHINDNQNSLNGPSLQFTKTKNFGATDTFSQLGNIGFYGNTGLNTTIGAIITARQNGVPNTYVPTDIEFTTYTANSENPILMSLTTTNQVGIGTTTPSYKLDVNGISRVTSTLENGVNSFIVANRGATSTSVELYLQPGTNNEAYGIYATQSNGSPNGTGLIPSTLQIYSYYPTANVVQTIYPNGNVQLYGNLNLPGSLTVGGAAISKVSCASAATLTSANFGQYCFINGAGQTLALPAGVEGAVIVIRNIGTGSITITGTADASGTSILPGKTTSYVYTTQVTAGWYAL